uniref:Plant bHLH transcription factor ACT-like domain-containing protein n=1 Tax=Salix viminalis TaxID=40686 RepID=A0A6N2LZS7_SALVM
MVSREQKRAAMYKKLQILRSITNSHAHDKASVILDASNYIKDLKKRVEKLNQDVSTAASFTSQNFPTIRVEEQENHFLIKVFTARNCHGLLVFILQAFEELGLEVLQARVSTSDSFLYKAIATRESTKEADDQIDAQVVKQVVLQGIQKWIQGSEQE